MRFNLVLLACIMALPGCMIVRNPTPQELSALDNPPFEVQSKVAQLLPKVEAWYSEVEIQLAPFGRPLTAEEARTAIELGVAEPEKVRVVVLDEFPMPKDEQLLGEAKKHGLGNWSEGGRSNGRVVLLKPRVAQSPAVLRHELVHLAQQDRMGRTAFLRRYLIELEMMGYARSPLELEAYARQGAH
ncbi:hypothetical protein J7E49_15250 [Variovorax paradoxus]|nr:hypothetical protein [Variovorax paradoxus]